MWLDLCVHKIPMAAGVQDWLQGREQGRKTDLGGGCRKGPNVRG